MTGRAVLDGLVAGCLIAGALLSLLAGIGMVRFPDVLSRMHAATKPQVLGSLLILLALAVGLRSGAELATLLLIGVFQLATAPLSAQMIGRAAYRTGRLRRDLLVVDELADGSATETGGPAVGEERTAVEAKEPAGREERAADDTGEPAEGAAGEEPGRRPDHGSGGAAR